MVMLETPLSGEETHGLISRAELDEDVRKMHAKGKVCLGANIFVIDARSADDQPRVADIQIIDGTYHDINRSEDSAVA